MSEVIVITSGKGGVGKTTASANIGTGLAQLGNKVVLIDTDIGLRNLDVVLGLENRIVYNLVDVVEGNCRIKQALIKDKNYPNLALLPSAQTRDKSAVTPEQMKKLTDELREEFDYVLLDCPAGIEQGFKNAIAGADRAIVVTTPEVSAIRDADRIIGLLEAAQIRPIDLVLNRIRMDLSSAPGRCGLTPHPRDGTHTPPRSLSCPCWSWHLSSSSLPEDRQSPPASSDNRPPSEMTPKYRSRPALPPEEKGLRRKGTGNSPRPHPPKPLPASSPAAYPLLRMPGQPAPPLLPKLPLPP